MTDLFKLADETFNSRLIIGTGKYRSHKEMQAAHTASGPEMVTVAVNPDKMAGVNVEGVTTFQHYLLAPATQARIRAFRLPGIDQQIWWPAGRTNASYALPTL